MSDGCEHTMDAAIRMQEAISDGNWPKLSDIKVWIMEELPPLPPGHPKPKLIKKAEIIRALIYLFFLMVAQVVFPQEDFATLLLVALGWWLIFCLITITMAGWMIRLGAEMNCHCRCG